MISSAIGIVLLAGLFIWALFAPATVRFVMEGIVWLVAALIGVEIVSGIFWLATNVPLLPEFHRWTAHLLVLFCWIVMAASIALLTRCFRERLGTSLLLCMISLVATAVVFLASFTGYLRPFAPGRPPEAKNRFLMLHCLVMPGVLAAIVPFWLWTVRLLRADALELNGVSDETPRSGELGEPPERHKHAQNDNPYASPGD